MAYIKRNHPQFNNEKINNFSKEYDIPTEIIELLFARGFDTKEKLDTYFNPSVSNFTDPFLLKNMGEVVTRLKKAIENREKLVILGDYDTDGISASAIMYKYFKSKNYNVDVFLPNRYIDGYGVTNDTIDKIIDMYNPDLILTVDCGISSVGEVEYCKSRGVEIIVTDHHEIPEKTPNTLIVNPKLPNQKYPFSELCGAGVAFKLVQAMSGIEEAVKYLSIAMLATVADIVPLVDENRAIVSIGLKRQMEDLPKGIVKLCREAGISLPLTSQDIAYKLAPKINASGRMGDATLSYRLFVEEDNKKINEYIKQLIEVNDRRIKETNKIYDSALEKLKDTNITNLGVIVLYEDDWEGGVLGIICSKLVDLYNKPVCLLSKVDNEYKGSCRSVADINIHEALTSMSDILIRFGGHNQAGGLSVTKENIDEFARRLNEFVLNKKSSNSNDKYYDIDLDFEVDKSYLEKLEKLQPFGCANEKPIFKIELNNVNATRLANYYKYYKFKNNNIEYMAFGLPTHFHNINSSCVKSGIVDLNLETYNKVTRVKGSLKNLEYGPLKNLKNKEILNANYLLQLFNSGENKPNIIKSHNINEVIKTLLEKSDKNTIVVANSFEAYKKCIEKNKFSNFELYYLNNNYGTNTLILAPNNNIDFKNYENVVFLDSPLSDGYLKSIKAKNIYIPEKPFNLNIFSKLDISRDTFGIYHNAIKLTLAKKNTFEELYEFYQNTKKLNPQIVNISYEQWIFVYMVMCQLGIITINNGEYKYNTIEKTQLHNSTIYNMVDVIINKSR